MGNLSDLIGGVSTTVVGTGQNEANINIQMKIEVVSLLPAVPDENTLYLIRA